MPKVSIIIPVYNVEKYLKECLDSVIKQTLQDIEIICVNDGSTDNSLHILKEYSQNDSRIKIIDKPNSGYGHTMNVGMKNATGEYIGIVESDDYVKENMFKVLYEKATILDLDFIKSDFYKLHSGVLTYTPLTRNPNLYNKIINPANELELFKMEMFNWTGIYKNKFLKDNNIRHNETPGASYQDTGFHFQVFTLAKKIYLLPEAFYCYRTDNPCSSINNPKNMKVVKTECDFIYDFIKRHNEVEKTFMQAFYLRKFQTFLFTFYRVEKALKKDFLKIFYDEFKTPYSQGLIDKNYLGDYEYSLLSLLLDNPNKFYHKLLNRMTLAQKIFSVKNSKERTHKIITICGVKFKIKRKKLG